MKFFQFENINTFDLKLIENPFKNLNLTQQKEENKSISFKLIIFNLEYWLRFDEYAYPNLKLELNICDNQFEWPLKNIEKQFIFKQFNESYIQSKYELDSEFCLSDFKFTVVNSLNDSSECNDLFSTPDSAYIANSSNSTQEFEIKELNILKLGVYYSTVSLSSINPNKLDENMAKAD